MSIPKRRQAIMDELNEASQKIGNLTILFTNALASRVGLSATEFECLSLLREGPLPAGRLAELCGLTTGAVTGLVDRLEKAGYAERLSDRQDRRRVLVAHKKDLQFEKRATELYGPLGDAFSELAEKYSLADLEVILGYLHDSNAMLERLTADFHRQANEAA
jgi:hypothetical protein